MAVITSLEALLSGHVLRGEAIAMRAFEAPATVRPATDEVLYLLDRDEGVLVPAGAEIEIGRGTVIAVSGGQTIMSVRTGRIACPPPVRLADQPIQQTGERWYRELIQSEITQFVGSIPPGRAPDHFHLYEEVLCILMGSGFLWADGTRTPVEVGSCVYLPRRQVHCVENSGSGELRLLGVFYPAGSPAARYGVEDRAGERPAGG
jgi:mannose-6-phosphate isomerase-like protein (cupin superfamily)